jgi:hypothetical protein
VHRWPPPAPRVDEHTGALHARVNQAHDYSRILLLRSETIAGARVNTELVRSASPGTRRIIRLHAIYTDEGDQVDRIIYCTDQLDEASCKRLLEREIRAAGRRSADALWTPGS